MRFASFLTGLFMASQANALTVTVPETIDLAGGSTVFTMSVPTGQFLNPKTTQGMWAFAGSASSRTMNGPIPLSQYHLFKLDQGS